MVKTMSKIIGAYVEITGTCNRNCPYCYNEKLVNSGCYIPISTLLKLFDQLSEKGLSSVTLSGGEPFLYDHLDEALEHSKHIGLGVNIVSNGLCFTEKNIDILTKYNPNIQITLDGFNEESNDKTRGDGCFKQNVYGIINSREKGYCGKIALRINLYKGNITKLERILDLIQGSFYINNNCILDSIHAAILHRTSDNNSQFDEYLDDDEYLRYPTAINLMSTWNETHSEKINYDFINADIGCTYNASKEEINCGLRIAPDGNVFPCQMFTDMRYSFGNINECGLDEILEGARFSRFVELIHARRHAISQCQECAFVLVCAGGCPAQALIERGSLNAVSNRCSIRKNYLKTRIQQIIRTP